jgi:hypothetical protein
MVREKKRHTKALAWVKKPKSFWQKKVSFIDNKKFLRPRHDKERMETIGSMDAPPRAASRKVIDMWLVVTCVHMWQACSEGVGRPRASAFIRKDRKVFRAARIRHHLRTAAEGGPRVSLAQEHLHGQASEARAARSLTHPLFPSVVHSPIHSAIRSPTHPPFQSVTHALAQPLAQSVTRTIRPPTHPPSR